MRFSGRAAKLTATKGPLDLLERLWMAWARISLPVPLSPEMRMVMSFLAKRQACFLRWVMAGDSPQKSSRLYLAMWPYFW